MGLPKKNRRIKTGPKQKTGKELRKSYVDNIADKGTAMPKGITLEDIDGEFKRFVTNQLDLTLEGDKVETYFVSIQRFAEIMQTWMNVDENDKIDIPFISIVRKPEVAVGTIHGGFANIPGFPQFGYCKVPKYINGKLVVDTYKIPQPIGVDVTYEVKLFALRMRDLNKMHFNVLKTFSSKQFYINVNGNPMGIKLESIGDESEISTMDDRRFYVQTYSMVLMGYLLDEDDFEVVRSTNTTSIVTELDNKVDNKGNFRIIRGFDQKLTQKCGTKDLINCPLCFEFDFNRQSVTGTCTTTVNDPVVIESSNHGDDNVEIIIDRRPVKLPYPVGIGSTLTVVNNLKGERVLAKLCGRILQIGDPFAATALTDSDLDNINLDFSGSLDSEGNVSGSLQGCHSITFTLQSDPTISVSITGNTGDFISGADSTLLETVGVFVTTGSTYNNITFSKNPAEDPLLAFDIVVGHSYSDDCITYSTNVDTVTIGVYFRLGFDNHIPKTGIVTTGYPVAIGGYTLQDETSPLAGGLYRMMPIRRTLAGLESTLRLERIKVNGVNYSTNFITRLSTDILPQFFADDITNIVRSVVSNEMPQLTWTISPPFDVIKHFVGMAGTEYTQFNLQELEFKNVDHNDPFFIGKKFFIKVEKHFQR